MGCLHSECVAQSVLGCLTVNAFFGTVLSNVLWAKVLPASILLRLPFPISGSNRGHVPSGDRAHVPPRDQPGHVPVDPPLVPSGLPEPALGGPSPGVAVPARVRAHPLLLRR
eukprot:1188559-Rhodomonas_salina.1